MPRIPGAYLEAHGCRRRSTGRILDAQGFLGYSLGGGVEHDGTVVRHGGADALRVVQGIHLVPHHPQRRVDGAGVDEGRRLIRARRGTRRGPGVEEIGKMNAVLRDDLHIAGPEAHVHAAFERPSQPLLLRQGRRVGQQGSHRQRVVDLGRRRDRGRVFGWLHIVVNGQDHALNQGLLPPGQIAHGGPSGDGSARRLLHVRRHVQHLGHGGQTGSHHQDGPPRLFGRHHSGPGCAEILALRKDPQWLGNGTRIQEGGHRGDEVGKLGQAVVRGLLVELGREAVSASREDLDVPCPEPPLLARRPHEGEPRVLREGSAAGDGVLQVGDDRVSAGWRRDVGERR